MHLPTCLPAFSHGRPPASSSKEVRVSPLPSWLELAKKLHRVHRRDSGSDPADRLCLIYDDPERLAEDWGREAARAATATRPVVASRYQSAGLPEEDLPGLAYEAARKAARAWAMFRAGAGVQVELVGNARPAGEVSTIRALRRAEGWPR